MKKIVVLAVSALLVMSSCGSYEAAGAYTGAHFGSIIGSAIGGINGGWRGHEVGSLIGLAGGAVVGAAIGKAADEKAEARATERYERHRQANAARHQQDDIYGSDAFDPSGRGDDRIMIDGLAPGPTAPAALQINNARLLDATRDGWLSRGESARMVFEIHNPTSMPVYGVQPSVIEVTRNKHIHISENILVECIQPNETIRYTAQVKADNRLKDGEAVIRISVLQSGREISSQSRDFRIRTSKHNQR